MLLSLHSQARAELDAAVAYYEGQKPGLGHDFLNEVERVFTIIRDNPEIGSPYKTTQFRFHLVRRFPYVIYYRRLENTLWTVAVALGKRRPDYWIKRRPERL